MTRTGLDWTHKYPPIAAAVSALGARQAYIDGGPATGSEKRFALPLGLAERERPEPVHRAQAGELERLWRRLQPLAVSEMPLSKNRSLKASSGRTRANRFA
jgi:hypothetical protein